MPNYANIIAGEVVSHMQQRSTLWMIYALERENEMGECQRSCIATAINLKVTSEGRLLQEMKTETDPL
jgi:hypothetical protein